MNIISDVPLWNWADKELIILSVVIDRIIFLFYKFKAPSKSPICPDFCFCHTCFYRVRTGLKSTWIWRVCLKSPWRLCLPWKVLENHSKALKRPWNLLFSVWLNTVDQYKSVVPIFGAANTDPVTLTYISCSGDFPTCRYQFGPFFNSIHLIGFQLLLVHCFPENSEIYCWLIPLFKLNIGLLQKKLWSCFYVHFVLILCCYTIFRL